MKPIGNPVCYQHEQLCYVKMVPLLISPENLFPWDFASLAKFAELGNAWKRPEGMLQLCHCWVLSPLRESSGTPQSAVCSWASCSHSMKSVLVIKLPIPRELTDHDVSFSGCNLVLAIAQSRINFTRLISFNLHKAPLNLLHSYYLPLGNSGWQKVRDVPPNNTVRKRWR